MINVIRQWYIITTKCFGPIIIIIDNVSCYYLLFVGSGGHCPIENYYNQCFNKTIRAGHATKTAATNTEALT